LATTGDVAALGVARIGASNFSYRLGTSYGSIDATVNGSWMFDGTASFPNKLGVNDAAPVTGGRAADTGYVAGAAGLSAILAGYDNVCNAQAAIIASQHSIVYSGGDHGMILGGSLHAILGGANYSVILGGTDNVIETDCSFAAIIGGSGNLVEAGASAALSGKNGIIVGGVDNVLSGQYGVVVGGSDNEVTGIYGIVVGGDACAANAAYVLAGGNSVTVSGTYSFGFGNAISVAGARCFAVGDNHTIASTHNYSSALGTGGVTPFSGAHVFASRNRGGTAGRNQSLQFQCSQETTDTTVARLSLAGSSTFPVQPADSVVSGAIEVVGVNDAGVCSAFRIDFVSERIGTGTPTLRQNATTTKYNGLALGTVPTMNVTTGGIYRVQVVGLDATNIRWNAVAMCSQIVFT
jgi:hypothetical protein